MYPRAEQQEEQESVLDPEQELDSEQVELVQDLALVEPEQDSNLVEELDLELEELALV